MKNTDTALEKVTRTRTLCLVRGIRECLKYPINQPGVTQMVKQREAAFQSFGRSLSTTFLTNQTTNQQPAGDPACVSVGEPQVIRSAAQDEKIRSSFRSRGSPHLADVVVLKQLHQPAPNSHTSAEGGGNTARGINHRRCTRVSMCGADLTGLAPVEQS